MIENTFYRIKQPYSITINPMDKFQYLGKPNRIISFRNFIYEKLISWVDHDIDYYFKMELSEPHQNLKQGYSGSRYHLHGIIVFKTTNALHWFLEQQIYKVCRYAHLDIDTIADISQWVEYMQKQKIIPKQYRTLTNYVSFEEFLTAIVQ